MPCGQGQFEARKVTSPIGEIEPKLPLDLVSELRCWTRARKIPGILLLCFADTFTQGLQRTVQLLPHKEKLAHTRSPIERVTLEMAEREQEFQTCHITGGIRFLNFVPEGRSFDIPICARVWVQLTSEAPIENLYPIVDYDLVVAFPRRLFRLNAGSHFFHARLRLRRLRKHVPPERGEAVIVGQIVHLIGIGSEEFPDPFLKESFLLELGQHSLSATAGSVSGLGRPGVLSPKLYPGVGILRRLKMLSQLEFNLVDDFLRFPDSILHFAGFA